jgi:hypothetical protein
MNIARRVWLAICQSPIIADVLNKACTLNTLASACHTELIAQPVSRPKNSLQPLPGHPNPQTSLGPNRSPAILIPSRGRAARPPTPLSERRSIRRLDHRASHSRPRRMWSHRTGLRPQPRLREARQRAPTHAPTEGAPRAAAHRCAATPHTAAVRARRWLSRPLRTARGRARLPCG